MATAIYARQSVEKKDSISIETQISACKAKCGDNEEIVVYKDKGFSGKNMQRPAFQDMMRDVESKRIKKIIVYRLDRLSRSVVDFGNLWEKLNKHNVSFCSVSEEFDTTNPIMGKTMAFIVMVFAQFERETISGRVTDNYYERAKRGSWLGGPAPYGFKTSKIVGEDGKKIPTLETDEKMEVVKRIFYEYAKEGSSLGSIAKQLTEEGIPCAKRKSWDSVSVSRLLHSPLYVKADIDVYTYYKAKGVENFSNEIGQFDGTTSAQIFGKRKSSDRKYTKLEKHTLALTNFAGVIPSEIWLACQDKLDRNKQLKNSGKGKYTWLTGIMKCGNCGYSMCVRVNCRNGKKYLGCSGKYNLHVCDVAKIELDISEIESEVQKELEKVLVTCYGQHEDNPVCDMDTDIKMELAKIEEKIERLVVCMAEGSDVTVNYIDKEIRKLDMQKQKILKENARKREKEKRDFKEIVFDELEMNEKRKVAETFIEKILIFNDSIEIIWKV